MPISQLKSLAQKAGVSLDKAEKLWKKAVSVAKEQGRSPDDEEFYAVVVGIVKNMLKLDTMDMLALGWKGDILTEAIISRSSASFMKARARKVADEIGNIESGDTNWKSVALNMRLFFNEFLSALSSRTGLKALLLGESKLAVPQARKMLNEVETKEELLDTYKKLFPTVNEGVLLECIG